MFKATLASLLLACSFGALADTTVDVSKIYGNIKFVTSFPDSAVE